MGARGAARGFPIIARRTIPIGSVHADPAGPRSALACTVDVDGTEVDIVGVHTSSRVWELAPVRHLNALRPQTPAAASGPQ